jgi:hypothetical protein
MKKILLEILKNKEDRKSLIKAFQKEVWQHNL